MQETSLNLKKLVQIFIISMLVFSFNGLFNNSSAQEGDSNNNETIVRDQPGIEDDIARERDRLAERDRQRAEDAINDQNRLAERDRQRAEDAINDQNRLAERDRRRAEDEARDRLRLEELERDGASPEVLERERERIAENEARRQEQAAQEREQLAENEARRQEQAAQEREQLAENEARRQEQAENEANRLAENEERLAYGDSLLGAENPYTDTEITDACPDNGQLFGRIIHCFEEKFFEGTAYFINNLYPRYEGMVYATMTLAVIILGIMLATGGVQSTPKETFSLLLKMVAIIFFMDNVILIYSDFLSIMATLLNEIASAGSNIFGGTLRCPATTGDIAFDGNGIATTPVWQRADCVFDGVVGISASVINGGGGSTNPDLSRGMMGFFYHNLKSGALGLIIGLAGLYIAFNLMLALFKGAYTYLIAVATMSLLFVIGILIVPAFLFPGTFVWFEKWYKMILGLMIQVLVLFGYLNIMMIAFDLMLFSGNNSILSLVCQGGAANQSITVCAENNNLYIDTSVKFAKEFDPSDIPVELSNQDLGALGNIQTQDENVNFNNPTTVPIDLFYKRVDYTKIDPANLAAATLLAGLCSYILIMFLNELPAMATELAGGARQNPAIISGRGGDIQAPMEAQLGQIASGGTLGNASGQVANRLSGLIGGR
jgi:type IV secretory pathway VirB6-like protein